MLALRNTRFVLCLLLLGLAANSQAKWEAGPYIPQLHWADMGKALQMTYPTTEPARTNSMNEVVDPYNENVCGGSAVYFAPWSDRRGRGVQSYLWMNTIPGLDNGTNRYSTAVCASYSAQNDLLGSFIWKAEKITGTSNYKCPTQVGIRCQFGTEIDSWAETGNFDGRQAQANTQMFISGSFPHYSTDKQWNLLAFFSHMDPAGTSTEQIFKKTEDDYQPDPGKIVYTYYKDVVFDKNVGVDYTNVNNGNTYHEQNGHVTNVPVRWDFTTWWGWNDYQEFVNHWNPTDSRDYTISVDFNLTAQVYCYAYGQNGWADAAAGITVIDDDITTATY